MVNFHYRPTWDPDRELLDTSRTKVVMSDCAVARPAAVLLRQLTMTRARQQETMEANHQPVESRAWSTPAELRARRPAAS